MDLSSLRLVSHRRGADFLFSYSQRRFLDFLLVWQNQSSWNNSAASRPKISPFPLYQRENSPFEKGGQRGIRVDFGLLPSFGFLKRTLAQDTGTQSRL